MALGPGKSFSTALLSNGRVLAWGSNEYGQLGVKSEIGKDVLLPLQTQVEGIVSIAGGVD